MVFSSLAYLAFLPLVWLVYCTVGHRGRWAVLLVCSYLFYAWLNIPYLLAVLALNTVATYGCAILLHRSKAPTSKKVFFLLGIALNAGILIGMKYLLFLGQNLEAVVNLLPVAPISVAAYTPIFVTIGVSYFTFQALSYLADIYLEIIEPELHLGVFALYMAFFPKLLQGPIERADALIPQFYARYSFDYANMRYGILLFGWGAFKKTAIADRLGLYVDAVYAAPAAFHGVTTLLASYAYAFQIYFDFSAYTDMALGSALLFNIRLTDNFNRPYLATSVADFWRRWHITFSRWILDYIFRPLQMRWRRGRNYGTAAALLLTFTLSGIWHGASWNFVIWGILHGMYLSASIFYRPWQKRIHQALHIQKSWVVKLWQIFCTFHLVTFAWVFFRASNFGHAKAVLAQIGTSWNEGFAGVRLSLVQVKSIIATAVANSEYQLLLFSSSIAVLVLLSIMGLQRLQTWHWTLRWGTYVVLLGAIILGRVPAYTDFIYFQF